MEGHENVNFKSGLRLPNGYHAAATCLQEITDSQSNSRVHTSTMPPPQQGIKRAYTGNMSQPDRDPKRKTLMEMAGEPTGASRPQLPSAPPASARIGLKGNTIANLSNANVKPPVSATGIVLPRQISSASASLRPTTVGNFTKSMGPGSRPPSRPPTSMGFSQSQSINARQRGNTRSRPATAMGNNVIDFEGESTQQSNAWNVDDRLLQVESQFKVMKEAMNNSLTDKKALEEVVELIKTRDRSNHFTSAGTITSSGFGGRPENPETRIPGPSAGPQT
ncbi:hypothetical protein B0T26DRAFT_137085 [Lasiosphaeria miniovina]|uniref:Uncharacterized protein n=1 Tax=Lasiosphaeria miniovina TaxID=1954250 RepID=A0AA40E731_9PEZI|nr:uncharacterized protein B0T26DRAFT_137085 [Lasiosphaeria miniovina]KAK0727447.1 hypothetical protein B0T26DRAFT_137085 [Lasiosphaeria miniovina]